MTTSAMANAYRHATTNASAPLLAVLLVACQFFIANPCKAQKKSDSIEATPEVQQKIDGLIEEFLPAEATLTLDNQHSLLMRAKAPIERISIANPQVLEVVQFTPTEYELLGGAVGETTLTLWFANQQTIRYVVRVERSNVPQEIEYGNLQDQLNELFPNSFVQLIPVGDKLILRGQARDAREAAQILAVLTGRSVDQQGQQLGPGSFVNLGPASLPGADDIAASNVINMLEVPGEMQVMLKVRVAELSRSAGREIGADFLVNSGDFTFTSLLGLNSPTSLILNTDEVTLAIDAISSSSYSKILAEPNLVTRSGQTANFNAGGEFAVPTAVGIGGIGAASTSFRSFGTSINFTPTVMDKDLIRLQVAPSFSTVNNDLTVDGIPGLNSRTVFTSVDMREGQWLAVAGLIQDSQAGGKVKMPLLGDIPILGTLFSNRDSRRDETELIILVSPELIHPMDAKVVPQLLPGFEVTEPADWSFYLFGRYEGNPHCHHRSTIYPIYRDRVVDAMLQAWHETKAHPEYQTSEQYFIQGEHGFTE